MALRKAGSAKKSDGKKAKAKSAKPAERARPAGRAKAPPIKAKAQEKRAVARPALRPSGKAEPPAVDHAAALSPLFLGASHGHLSRPVDKQWLDALKRYRVALSDAVIYEGKRSAGAR